MIPAADAPGTDLGKPLGPTFRLLMVGSSIFEQWVNPAVAFPNCSVVNAAIGGTQTDDWLDRLPDALNQHRPDVLALYCGSNDLARGQSPETVIGNTRRLRELLTGYDAAAPMLYFNVIQCPAKLDYWDQVQRVNAAVRELLHPGDTVVDPNAVFVDHQLDPPQNTPCVFQDDGVHLTAKGYHLLSAHVRGELMRHRWFGLDSARRSP